MKTTIEIKPQKPPTVGGWTIPDGTVFIGTIGIYPDKLMVRFDERIYSLDHTGDRPNFWLTNYVEIDNFQVVTELKAIV
jgi:hypothetical protein